MNREKVIDLVVNEIRENIGTYTIDIAEGIVDKIYPEFEQEKKDMLKEFVEWYKKVLKKDFDDKALMMNHTEEQEIEDRWFYRGQCTVISRLITLLDSDLENFLKEKFQ